MNCKVFKCRKTGIMPEIGECFCHVYDEETNRVYMRVTGSAFVKIALLLGVKTEFPCVCLNTGQLLSQSFRQGALDGIVLVEPINNNCQFKDKDEL